MSFMVFNGLLWSFMVFRVMASYISILLLSCCLVVLFHRFIVSSFHRFMWSGNLESLDLLPIT